MEAKRKRGGKRWTSKTGKKEKEDKRRAKRNKNKGREE